MGKKHKKKVYTTPKKSKKIHKKICLNDFINSLNQNKCATCLSTLANHHDRYYCGKCEVSITHNSCMQQEKELHL